MNENVSSRKRSGSTMRELLEEILINPAGKPCRFPSSPAFCCGNDQVFWLTQASSFPAVPLLEKVAGRNLSFSYTAYVV